MRTSQLLLMGVQDFMGKPEYVRPSDFQRTEANFQRKTPQMSTSASAGKKNITFCMPGILHD